MPIAAPQATDVEVHMEPDAGEHFGPGADHHGGQPSAADGSRIERRDPATVTETTMNRALGTLARGAVQGAADVGAGGLKGVYAQIAQMTFAGAFLVAFFWRDANNNAMQAQWRADTRDDLRAYRAVTQQQNDALVSAIRSLENRTESSATEMRATATEIRATRVSIEAMVREVHSNNRPKPAEPNEGEELP